MSDLPPIQKVVIIGAGWVGRQVAARMLQFGVDVCLVDKFPEVAKEAAQWIREQEEHHCFSGALITASSIDATIEFAPQLVLENVSEQVSLKKRVLREAAKAFPAPTIIASNSSYFVPSLLAPYVSQPERFAHLHFHVPVLRESVADIVGCEQTEPSVIDRLSDLANRIEQKPLLLRRENPGYVFNWLLQSVLKSALQLVALDVVDAADVDHSWKSVTGMSKGPFEIMDQIGLDVVEQVLANGRWADETHLNDEDLLQLLQQLTSVGKLGVKSGEGFYEYGQAGKIQ